MSYTVTQESFTELASYCKNSGNHLNWSSVFVLPAWLEVWWRVFQPEAELYLSAVRQGADIIGIAPLQLKEETASFIGDIDVCDYLDFVITPGRENDVFAALIDNLRNKGINHLDLAHVRPDSTVLTSLEGIARSRGYEVLCQVEEITLEMDLPATWDEYLAILSGKQRHEVRRKLRRLREEGNVDYRYFGAMQEEVAGFMDIFLKLFALSREEKADFMTDRRESFFRSLAEAMADIGLLRFGILELDKLPAAMIMGFDYNDSVYLYNSGYDPGYSSLTAGLLSKVLCIKDSIEKGRKKFDFLKGTEAYKYQLGGREIPLYRCRVTIR